MCQNLAFEEIIYDYIVYSYAVRDFLDSFHIFRSLIPLAP